MKDWDGWADGLLDSIGEYGKPMVDTIELIEGLPVYADDLQRIADIEAGLPPA